MSDFSFDTPDPNDVAPGRYYVEVTDVQSKISEGSGNRYWRVKWCDPDTSRRIVEDIWMLEGNGVGMTKKRLKVLGFDGGSVSEGDLIGKRAWVQVTEREFRGDKQPAVDTKAKESQLGYWPEGAFEIAAPAPSVPTTADGERISNGDIPF